MAALLVKIESKWQGGFFALMSWVAVLAGCMHFFSSSDYDENGYPFSKQCSGVTYFGNGFFLGLAVVLIVVAVGLDFIQRIEASLLMRNYAGFLGEYDRSRRTRRAS